MILRASRPHRTGTFSKCGREASGREPSASPADLSDANSLRGVALLPTGHMNLALKGVAWHGMALGAPYSPLAGLYRFRALSLCGAVAEREGALAFAG